MPACAGPVAPATAAAEALVVAFLAGRRETTLRAYRQDLAAFAEFLQADSPAAAARELLAGGPGRANGLALAYRAHLIDRGRAAATVNRRLAALRSLVKLARVLGFVNWSLDVEGVRDEPLRDSRGPGRQGVRRLLMQLAERRDAKGARDGALVRLLFDLGLRRAEAVGLDVADLDLAGESGGAVFVLGKGRTSRERLTLPGPTRRAVEAWLAFRGREPGPLFVRLDPGAPVRPVAPGGRQQQLQRMTGAAVYKIVRSLGERAGVRARPHGLRHAAITEALELTGGDVRAVQRFSRHKDVRVVQRYDDNRQDVGGDVARRLSERCEEGS